MAAIEDLIKQIADTRLRDQLAAEVARLKSQKKFGLVFEEHLPELLRLPGMAARLGSRVLKKDDPRGVPYRVTAEVNGNRIKVRPEGGGDEETIERAAVVVARAFGEPMYPALIPVDAVERAPGKPWHALINADNYHALQLLLYGYEGKVDVIYIDPPYNTGARDWKYNNDYVDDTDQFRHSKWLSMMKKRLLLATRLLKPDGVMIVTIDEHETQNLGVLLRELMPTARVQMVTIVTNTAGSLSPGLFSRSDEYAYFCFFGNAKPMPLETDLLSEAKPTSQYWFPLFRSRGLNDRPSKRPNLVYPIAIDPKTLRIVGAGRTLKERILAGEVKGDIDKWLPPENERLKGLPVIWPLIGERELSTWQVDAKKLGVLCKAGFVRVRKANGRSNRDFSIAYVKSGNRKKVAAGEIPVTGRDESGALILGDTERTSIPKTTWKVAYHDARLYGTTMLRELVGPSSFTYPKSPYAVMDCIRAVLANRSDGIVLDFFAGSGTTTHAVAMLNAADGGSRRSIVVTNNEVDEATAKRLASEGIAEGSPEWDRHGVAQSVTWPRLQAAFTGARSDGTRLQGQYLDGRDMADGFEENAAFFSLDFLDPGEVTRGEKFEAIVPILWMLAGCRGACHTAKGSGKWFMPKGNPFAVLMRDDAFREFVPALKERADVDHIFLVTDSTEAFHDMANDLGDSYRCIQLYRSYLDTFRINLIEPGTISPSGVPTVSTPAAAASTVTSAKVEA